MTQPKEKTHKWKIRKEKKETISWSFFFPSSVKSQHGVINRFERQFPPKGYRIERNELHGRQLGVAAEEQRRRRGDDGAATQNARSAKLLHVLVHNPRARHQTGSNAGRILKMNISSFYHSYFLPPTYLLSVAY